MQPLGLVFLQTHCSNLEWESASLCEVMSERETTGPGEKPLLQRYKHMRVDPAQTPPVKLRLFLHPTMKARGVARDLIPFLDCCPIFVYGAYMANLDLRRTDIS